MDWIGIYLYLQSQTIMDLVAFEILHIRIILLVYNFRQLLAITFTKDQLKSATKSKTKRTLLSGTKKSLQELYW